MTLINTNVVASRLIKREKALLPVAVRRSKTQLNFVATKASRIPPNLNFPGETEFVFAIFCLDYLGRRREKVDGHFANCRFSFRDLLIFISFCSISFRKLL